MIRQLLTESLLLALLGAAGGVLLARFATEALLPFAGDAIPRIRQAGIDDRVLAFSTALALLTCVLFSLAPALQVAKTDLVTALKEGARSVAGGHDRLRGALVAGQIALGLVLLSGASLLIASFHHLTQRDPGFQPDHTLVFSVSLPGSLYNRDQQIRFYDRLIEQLRSVPGVQSAAGGGPLPLTGHEMTISFSIEERPTSGGRKPYSDMAIVTPGYFRTMGIPLLKGRDFIARDDLQTTQVLIVNKAFADRFFPGEDVIGKRMEPGATTGRGGTRMREIVGVVGNAKQAALTAPEDPIYYFPYKQLPWFLEAVELRTSVPPLSVESAARATVASIDPQVPVFRVRTMEELASTAITPARFLTLLLASFAAIALLLTVVGLYGVMVYSVTRREREIGVRIALGASRARVLSLVLKQALMLVAAGLVIGVAGALAAGRVLRGMLYGVSPRDPALLAIACVVVTATGILAAYLPARRAASTDPVEALRSE